MSENIKIAFCFDKKMQLPVCVAIASLLDVSVKNDVHYDIMCIHTSSILEMEKTYKLLVNSRDELSNIFFISAENDYKNAFEIRNVSVGTYLRLQLPKLLSGLDKVIYVDVDVLFKNDLKELWDKPINNYILGAIKNIDNEDSMWKKRMKEYPYWKGLKKGNYFNAGVLLINLKKIRELGLENVWKTMGQEKYGYQDQDILNISCANKIKFLPVKFNFLAGGERLYKKCIKQNIFTVKDFKDEPAIIHYAGPKPWDDLIIRNGLVWHRYVLSQGDLKKIFKKLYTIGNIKKSIQLNIKKILNKI